MSDPVQLHDWVRSVARGADEANLLPPHYPTCLGCGPDAEQGLHLQVYRDGDEVFTTYVFDSRHSGGPGIVHGGIVATVIDDVLGHLLHVVHAPGVTRHLEVDYLAPVLVGVSYTVRGRIESREGRKLWFACTGTDPEGNEVFAGRGLFIVVDLAHFEVPAAPGGQEPVNP